MRLLILAVCLATPFGYVPDRLYKYRYVTTLYTGYSNLKPQYQALSLKFDVLVQRQFNYYMLMLQNPQIARANNVSSIEDYRYEYVDSPELDKLFSTSFRVWYSLGEIRQYDISSRDGELVMNIKKAFLQFFSPRFHFEEEEYLRQPDPNGSYYTVFEDGLDGRCETTYFVSSQPYYNTSNNKDVLNVTRTKNYHNCFGEPYLNYGPLHGEVCEECDTEGHFPLHKNSRYHYDIRGNRSDYIIEKAYSEGQIIYTPYTPHAQTAFVYENRTLELLEENSGFIQNPKDFLSHFILDSAYGHQHYFGTTVDLKKAHYTYIFKPKIATEEIGSRIDHIVSLYSKIDTSVNLDEQLTAVFADIVRYVSLYNYSEIDRVYRQYIAHKSEKHKLLFHDVLSVVGTNPAFLYGVDLIRDGNVSTDVAKHFLQAIALHLKEPSNSLLDEYQDLCDHPYVRRRSILHSTCYLTFAGLVHQICVAGYHNKVEEDRRYRKYPYTSHIYIYNVSETHCTPGNAAERFNHFVSQYRNIVDEYYEIAFLKIITNFGVLESLHHLKPYIHDEQHHLTYYRVSAVWALKRVVEFYPDEVLDVLLPVYFNTSEDYEVRIAAFSVVLRAHPKQYQLETVARSLYEEPSDQVASFVYSTFNYLANSSHPCHRRISRLAQYILTALEDYENIHPSLDHAFNYLTAGYEAKYDYGGYTQFTYIPSNSSYIPRNLYLNVNDYVGGKSYDTFAFGFHQYGLDKYFDRIFGPQGLFGDGSFEFFGRRSPRDANHMREEVQEIEEKLNMYHRDYEPVYGNVYLNVYGTQIDFFYFNEYNLEYFLRGDNYLHFLRYRGHRPFIYRHFTSASDKTVVYPLECGLSLIYEVKQPFYIHYHNNKWNFEVTPEPPKKGLYVPKQVKLHLDGHLVYDRTIEVSLEIPLPGGNGVIGVGAITRSALNVPVKLDVTADVEKHKFLFKHTPLVPHEIYQSSFLPYTQYVNLHEVREDEYRADVEKNLLHDEDLEETEEDYFQDYFGIGYRVHYRSLPTWNDYGSWKEFLASKDLHQKLYYYYYQPHFHPYVFNVTLIGADGGATKEIEGTFNYDYHHLEERDNVSYKSKHFSEGLEDYGSDKKWYSHALNGEITARGKRERKVKAELAYSYTYDYLYHKYHLYYERTPFHASEHSNLKVCSAGYIKYPHHDHNKFYALETQNLDYSTEAEVNVHFGKDCNCDRKIRIKTHADRTEEQNRHEARRLEPVTYDRFNEYAYYYQKCMEERKNRHQYNSYCRYYLYLVSQLRNYRIVVTYENLPDYFLNYTYQLASIIKHYYYYHVDTNAYITNVNGSVHVEANMSLHDPVADIRVFKPHETTHYNNVRLNYFRPLNTLTSFDYSYLQEYLGYYDYPYCLVQSDQVITFDNFTYELPPINCYKVIAKDCSPKEEFVVLGKKISPNQKAVVIYLGEYKVEAQPDGSKADIRVNDQAVPVNESHPYYEEVGASGTHHPVFFVSYNGLYYTIRSRPYGLTFKYDGHAIYIQLSYYWKGKLCGLCGDYNSDRQYELRGPENRVYYNTDDYGYSYTLRDDQCTVPDHQ